MAKEPSTKNNDQRHPAHNHLDELEAAIGKWFNGVVTFGEGELKDLVSKVRSAL